MTDRISLVQYIKLPRLLLAGQPGNGQLHFVCPALLFELNEYTIHTVSLSVFDADGIQGLENASLKCNTCRHNSCFILIYMHNFYQ